MTPLQSASFLDRSTSAADGDCCPGPQGPAVPEGTCVMRAVGEAPPAVGAGALWARAGAAVRQTHVHAAMAILIMVSFLSDSAPRAPLGSS